MRSVADAVIGKLNERLQNDLAGLDGVFVIDQRGLLTPAAADANGESNDWLDEIHPTRAGFEKLARNRWDVRLSRALGWQFGPDETEPALEPTTASTALADPIDLLRGGTAPT